MGHSIFRIFLAQPSTLAVLKKEAAWYWREKNKSRFFSGFYVSSKKTAPPFL